MKVYDYLIIGGGLGGLLCGLILSREGKKVCLVEKNTRLGGSIQSFARKGVIFNTGFNFTESLGVNETLYKYFKFFGILDNTEFKQMDLDSFERISFSGDSIEYPLAQGYQHFINSLSEYFPEEKEAIENYIVEIKDIAQQFPLYSLNGNTDMHIKGDFLSIGAYERIKHLTKNEKLQGILAGMNSLYGGDKNLTPYYVHALINYSYIRSSWRIVDGSMRFIRRIVKVIKDNGGDVFRNSKVIKLSGDKLKGVEYALLENGETIQFKKVIANIHPQVGLELVDKNLLKKGQYLRIKSLKNSMGMFSLYIVLKRNSFPYINYNHHCFKTKDVWTANHTMDSWPHHYMMYTPVQNGGEEWARGMQVLTYLPISELEQWENTQTGNRGSEYEEFKTILAEKLLDFMEEKFPNLRESIDCYYTATPLTYRDYTGTIDGSAYGIMKNYKDPFSTIISPKSRVKNLYFTGQNLNMHGILGVSIGAVLTCGEFLGHDYLIKKISEIND